MSRRSTLQSALELFRVIESTCSKPATKTQASRMAEKCADKLNYRFPKDHISGLADAVFGDMHGL